MFYRKIESVKKLFLSLAACSLLSCGSGDTRQIAEDKDSVDSIFARYWNEKMVLFPIDATANGDNRYNDQLTITISDQFRDSLKRFYSKYLELTNSVDTSKLNESQMVSYRLFRYEMQMSLEGLKHPTNLMPINQFWAFTLEMPQLGSGTGNQPFKSVKDYENWLKRLFVFPAWTDTAIANMRKGIKAGWVLPKALVEKMLPQISNVITEKDTSSIFFEPAKHFPSEFNESDKARLAIAYKEAVNAIVNPVYKKLLTFFKDEYLPAARSSSGIGSLPGGAEYYQYCIKYWTTTGLTPDSIFKIGLAEVARIEGEMLKVKEQTGFKGDLQALFRYVEKDSRFCPFKTPKEVLDSFWNIKKKEDPKLASMFSRVPKTQFTIRQTEAFRAASASAEYNQGSEDGSRPGIFYVPILDATKFNATGMATLFLHEAIPGHHYQISLQQENRGLPAFRRFSWYGAYGEGWAHYCETLGKGLGLYDDPYQYLGHLGDAMHRAIRLVVDVGMHNKGMTREDAIKYMMAHELISEHDATAEIERYMAIPGQALSYKIGQMAILSERHTYEEKMGPKFSLASFHDEVLQDGCLPLALLHEKLVRWSAAK